MGVAKVNLEEIIEEINKDADDTLDNSEVIGWINRGLDDLTILAKYQRVATVMVISGQKEYELPSDLVSLKHVVMNGKLLKEIPIGESKEGYKLWEQLILQPTPTEDAQIELYYYATLPRVIEMTDVPKIPSLFHDLLVYYTLAKYNFREEEETIQLNAWNDYLNRKTEFARYMNRTTITPIRDVYGV